MLLPILGSQSTCLEPVPTRSLLGPGNQSVEVSNFLAWYGGLRIPPSLMVQRCLNPAAHHFKLGMDPNTIKSSPCTRTRNCLDLLYKLHGNPHPCRNSIDTTNRHATSAPSTWRRLSCHTSPFEEANLMHSRCAQFCGNSTAMRLRAGLMKSARLQSMNRTRWFLMAVSTHRFSSGNLSMHADAPNTSAIRAARVHSSDMHLHMDHVSAAQVHVVRHRGSFPCVVFDALRWHWQYEIG